MDLTVGELMEILEGMDQDSVVRIAEQPSWPFEYDLNAVVEADGKVWIVEGNQLGYLEGEIKGVLGW